MKQKTNCIPFAMSLSARFIRKEFYVEVRNQLELTAGKYSVLYFQLSLFPSYDNLCQLTINITAVIL